MGTNDELNDLGDPLARFAAQNNARRETMADYDTGRFSNPRNGRDWTPTREQLSTLFRAAADLLDNDDAVADPWLMADLYCWLREAPYCLPELTVWCVVKHYGREPGRENGWRPRPWTGHLTEEQATEYAEALAEHYGPGDRWLVERRPITVPNIIRPDFPAARFVARLGR